MFGRKTTRKKIKKNKAIDISRLLIWRQGCHVAKRPGDVARGHFGDNNGGIEGYVCKDQSLHFLLERQAKALELQIDFSIFIIEHQSFTMLFFPIVGDFPGMKIREKTSFFINDKKKVKIIPLVLSLFFYVGIFI